MPKRVFGMWRFFTEESGYRQNEEVPFLQLNYVRSSIWAWFWNSM